MVGLKWWGRGGGVGERTGWIMHGGGIAEVSIPTELHTVTLLSRPAR